MTPFRWFIVAVAVLGGIGIAYWLLKPRPTATGSGSLPPGTTGFLASGLGTSATVLLPPSGGVVDGTDQGGGNYSSNPNWTIGDYGAPVGSDFEGRSFERTAVPIIPFEAKNQPYQYGINYYFPEQTAKGATLFKRFPAFNMTDAQLHLMGPWYSDADANAHFSRGVTTLSVLPNYRQGPTDATALPYTQKSVMYSENIVKHYAEILMNTGGGDNTILQNFINGLMQADQSAESTFVALGRLMYQQEKSVLDQTGKGSLYVTFNIENIWPTDPQLSQPYLQNCFGYLYDGYCGAAYDDGVLVRPFNYGSYQMQIELDASSFRDGSGFPNYLQPQYDFLAGGGPILQAMQKYGGVMAIDDYIQGIWGNEPFLQRDVDGSPITDGQGNVYFAQNGSTTVYGQTVSLEINEAQRALLDIYEHATRLYLQLHRLADDYPSYDGQRRSNMENIQAGAFTRWTNEGVAGIVQNDRPIPAWQMELFNALGLFLSPHVYAWGVEFNQEPSPLGSLSSVWPYAADGVVESLISAAYKHASFRNIQPSRFKWLWFNLPIVDNMTTPGNRFHEKALCFGKIRDVNGIVWLEILFAFPATDNTPTAGTIRVEQNGVVSQDFNFQTADGRSYFYDAWQLPSTFSYDGLSGSDVTINYYDGFARPVSHRGDYRVN